MNKYSDFSKRQGLINNSQSAKSLSPELSQTLNRFPNLRLARRLYISQSPEPCSSPFYLSAESPFSISLLNNQNQGLKHINPEVSKGEIRSLKLPNLDIKYTKKSDFSVILDQIENVVSPKSKFQVIILREDDPITQNISAKHPVYLKVFTKNKKTPLSVKIKEYGSKVVTYVSFSDSQPKSSSYDRVYFKSYFEVSDQAFEFKNDVLYLGVYSEKDCKFKIQINFGKIKTLKEIRSARIDEMELDDDEEFYYFKSLKKKNDFKDFIKANKDINYKLPSGKIKDLGFEHEKWLKKQAEVKLKKRMIVEAKKLKAIESLNRRARRLELEQKIKNELEIENSLNKFRKALISLMFFLKSIESIRRLVSFKRQNTFKRITKNMKITMLQKYIKKNFLKPNSQLSKDLASSSLMLFGAICKSILLRNTGDILIKAISQKANANLLVHQIGNFGCKILKIQRNYRRHLIIKRIQLKRLNDVWKSSIEKLIVGKQESKLKKTRIMKYKAIPVSAKNRFLGEYYQSCWMTFRQALHEYLQSKKNDLEVEVPTFSYMPSEAKMREMIQNLLKKKS